MSEDSWHWIFLSPSRLVFGSVDSSPPSPLAHLQSRKARQFWFHLDHNHLILGFPSPKTTHWTHPWIWMFPKIRAPGIASSVGESDSSRHPPKSNRRKNKWNGESMSVPPNKQQNHNRAMAFKLLFNLMPGFVPIPSLIWFPTDSFTFSFQEASWAIGQSGHPCCITQLTMLETQGLKKQHQHHPCPMPHVVQSFTNLSWWTRRSWRMTRRLIGTSVRFNLREQSWKGSWGFVSAKKTNGTNFH